VKAVQSAFANDAAPTIPLPDELQQTIEAFLDLQQNIDDHDSQRLHDELILIRNRSSNTSPERLGAFVHVLRLLRPAIRGEKRLGEWWTTVIKPIVDSVGHKRDTIEDAREFLLGILVFDADDDTTGENCSLSAQFTRRVLEAYLVRTKIPTTDEEVVSPEDEYIAQELEGILVAFGKKKPKVSSYSYMAHVDSAKFSIRNFSWPSMNSLYRKIADYRPCHCSVVSSACSRRICISSWKPKSSSISTIAF
jgi:hypothetical protein